MNWDEIAQNVQYSLLQYNKIPYTDIYTRVDWLLRAGALLKTGIKLKSKVVSNETDRRNLLELAEMVEKEVVPELRRIYTDPALARAMFILKNTAGDPKVLATLLDYIDKVNCLRDKLISIALSSGFEVFTPLIIGGSSVKKS